MASHWGPYGDLRRRLGAPVGAKGHKKAGSGPHSASNEVNGAIVDSPGVALCDENIINNMFISKTAPSPICSKRVAQRGLKASFWSPFGHFGPSRSGLWSTLGATERQQDAALCTDAFPGPKVVPDPLQNGRGRQGRRVCGAWVKHTFAPPGSVFAQGKPQSSKSTVLQPLKGTD